MQDTAEIELSIEEAQKKVADRDALKKLFGNRDFKRIFVEGYFKENALRLVGISAEPSTAAHHDDIHEEIRSISLLSQYLRNVITFGDIAEYEIGESREALDDQRAEEDV
jgi:hypothetical protein